MVAAGVLRRSAARRRPLRRVRAHRDRLHAAHRAEPLREAGSAQQRGRPHLPHRDRAASPRGPGRRPRQPHAPARPRHGEEPGRSIRECRGLRPRAAEGADRAQPLGHPDRHRRRSSARPGSRGRRRRTDPRPRGRPDRSGAHRHTAVGDDEPRASGLAAHRAGAALRCTGADRRRRRDRHPRATGDPAHRAGARGPAPGVRRPRFRARGLAERPDRAPRAADGRSRRGRSDGHAVLRAPRRAPVRAHRVAALPAGPRLDPRRHGSRDPARRRIGAGGQSAQRGCPVGEAHDRGDRGAAGSARRPGPAAEGPGRDADRIGAGARHVDQPEPAGRRFVPGHGRAAGRRRRARQGGRPRDHDPGRVRRQDVRRGRAPPRERIGVVARAGGTP